MVFSVRILYDKGRSVQSVLYTALYLQFQPAQKEDYPMMKSVSAWKQELSSGAHAARLASLYCCAPEETAPQAARYEAALNGLETTFGPHAEAGLYSAPGRTEIGGNHTDHQHGRVLDLMMPFMDGMTCLREMRARHINTPVIILTARGEEYDKLAGLEGGADDYVVKPFSPRELVARVKAVLNRTMPKPAAASDTMTFGELTIDTASHTVRVSGEEVALTPKEFDLLVFLASNKGIALSREKILQKVWNYDYFGEDRTVDTHVKMLRGHLGKCRSYIATVWGIGYKFDPDATR